VFHVEFVFVEVVREFSGLFAQPINNLHDYQDINVASWNSNYCRMI
jgi:hypothetical protein